MRSRLFLLCTLLVLACRQQSPGPASDSDHVLRLADQDEIPTLDPARGYDTASWQFEDLIFETLLDYDDKGDLVGEAAESWSASADFREFRFMLRPSRFSHGRSVRPGDFAYAVRRVLLPSTQSPGRDFYLGLLGARECDSTACDVPGIEAREPDLLIFRLETPDLLFLHKVALPFAAALPEEIVRERGATFSRNPTGSGPYRLREWRAGQYLWLEPNPYYEGAQPPSLAGILRQTGVGEELAWMQFLSGQLDVTGIPTADFLHVRGDPRWRERIHTITTLRTQYVGLNCSVPPFHDRRVRQALNYATDKEKLVRLLNGRAVAAVGVVPPNLPSYPERAPVYPYDPHRAEQLLRAAGYAAGFETTLWLRNDPTAMRIAQSLQQDWLRVGIHVKLRPLAWGVFLEAIREPGRVPMFLLGWEADFPDASNFLDVLFHSRQVGANNHTEYRNPAVDALLEAAARELSASARIQFLYRAEQAIIEDAPWIFLFHPSTFVLVQSRVAGFRLHPWRPPRVGRVRIEITNGHPPEPHSARPRNASGR